MFCPNCGERQTSEATQFCSKCGFTTKGVKQLLENGGEYEIELSPRQKGVRRGAKLILLSAILFPALILLGSLFSGSDRLVESSPDNTVFEQISLTILWTLFVAGAARIGYAFLFEKHFQSKQIKTAALTGEEKPGFQSNETRSALPPAESIPINNYGKWKETTREFFEVSRAREKTSGELK